MLEPFHLSRREVEGMTDEAIEGLIAAQQVRDEGIQRAVEGQPAPGDAPRADDPTAAARAATTAGRCPTFEEFMAMAGLLPGTPEKWRRDYEQSVAEWERMRQAK